MPDGTIQMDGLFKDHPGATLDPPWEPFWSCNSFASDDCNGICEHCLVRKDDMEVRA